MEMQQLNSSRIKTTPNLSFGAWRLWSVQVDEINVYQPWEIWRQLTDVSKSPSLKACSGAFGKKGWLVQGASATGIEITPSSKSAFVRSHADTFLRQILVQFEIFEMFCRETWDSEAGAVSWCQDNRRERPIRFPISPQYCQDNIDYFVGIKYWILPRQDLSEENSLTPSSGLQWWYAGDNPPTWRWSNH